jgi:EmrB/QacA subfamily drug resistance transporter
MVAVRPDAGHPQTAAGHTLGAALLGFFVITLDAVVVNVALPALGHDLAMGLTGLQWVVDGYTLMFAALLLAAGSLTDRLGARTTFAWGIAVFCVASLACGMANSPTGLVGARLLQGAAAAAMMPSSMALIGQAYPDPVRRGRAVAWWAMGGSVAATSGPVLGGALLAAASWRWIFWLNLPVCLGALWLLRRAPASARRSHPFDVIGQVLAAVSMGALTYGTIASGQRGPADPLVLSMLGLAVVAGAAFIVVQRQVAHPMVPSAVFGQRGARIAMAVGFAFMACYFGLPFVMSLYLQLHRGLSALDTGAHFLPMMLVGLVLTPFSARLMERWGARVLVVSGLACMVVGLCALAAWAPTASPHAMSAWMLLVGLGGPLVSPPITAVLLHSVPSNLAGIASGVYNTSRQVGGALAVGVFGALLNRSSHFEVGLRIGLLTAAGVALLTGLASLGLRPPGTADSARR